MGANIRRALDDDAAALADLAELTFPFACPPHVTDAAKADFIARHLTQECFARYLRHPATAVFLAEAEDGFRSVIGYSMLIEGAPAEPEVSAVVTLLPTVELSKFYVHPEHHGAGVAARLMGTSLDFARGRGAASVWLGVNEENERARRFYAKHRFAAAGRRTFLVGDSLQNDEVLVHSIAR